MGLDLTFYRQLTPAPDAEMEEGYPVDYANVALLHDNADFPGRSAPTPCEVPLRFKAAMHVNAGSYGGYSDWRNWLATLAGYDSAQDFWTGRAPEGAPFHALINFSDCEGTIGTDACRVLAADFAQFRPEGEDYQKARYYEMARGFALAADGGAVRFA